MKPILLLVLLLGLGAGSSALAQNRTALRVAPIPDRALQVRIETNGSHVLTAFNAAFRADVLPDLDAAKVTQSGRRDLEALWATAPFRCPEVRVTSIAAARPGAGGYEVRRIPLLIRDAGTRHWEEGVLLFDARGRFDGLYFGLDAQDQAEMLAGSQGVTDLERRQVILDFVENFRTAYNRRDVPFFEDYFSDNALILVGRVIEQALEREGGGDQVRFRSQQVVEYVRRRKQEYIERLRHVFEKNEFINVGFRHIDVYRHPRYPAIYGVTLLQHWFSETYSDAGYLFLMIDFEEEQRPKIHVRTWQPEAYVAQDEAFGLGDFRIIQ